MDIELISQRIPEDILATAINKPGIRVRNAEISSISSYFGVEGYVDKVRYSVSPDPYQIQMRPLNSSVLDVTSTEMDDCEVVLDLKLFLTRDKFYELINAQGITNGILRAEDMSINDLIKLAKKKANERL